MLASGQWEVDNRDHAGARAAVCIATLTYGHKASHRIVHAQAECGRFIFGATGRR